MPFLLIDPWKAKTRINFLTDVERIRWTCQWQPAVNSETDKNELDYKGCIKPRSAMNCRTVSGYRSYDSEIKPLRWVGLRRWLWETFRISQMHLFQFLNQLARYSSKNGKQPMRFAEYSCTHFHFHLLKIQLRGVRVKFRNADTDDGCMKYK